MPGILLFGAGKSATVLIDYLVLQCSRRGWSLEVVDAQPGIALEKLSDSCRLQGLDPSPFLGSAYDIHDAAVRRASIERATLVLSLLPPHLHAVVAADCLELGRSLFTASYVDSFIMEKAAAIEQAGLLFLYEMGLDPGIDHMSLMDLLDGIRAGGGVPTRVLSHCGGLVAPQSDDNPWHYKISWNPRNVVMAGKAGAQFLENERVVEKDHRQLFAEQRILQVSGVGEFAHYPNRDSLSYIDRYGLTGIGSFQRTTLRHPDFMRGWNELVRMGMIDEQRQIELKPDSSLATAFNRCATLPTGLPSDLQFMLEWLGWSDHQTIVPFLVCTPASLLQFAMEKKWVLHPEDKDRIVMVHEIDYRIGNEEKRLVSWLVDTGVDSLRTAMSKTVGLPIGIAAIQFLDKKWKSVGLQIPTLPHIYKPVLKELSEKGITFTERRD